MHARTSMRRSLAVVAAAALAVACDPSSVPPTEAVPPPDVRPYLTAEAAASLTGEGLFPNARPPQDPVEPVISAEQAGEFALGYVRAFGQFFHRDWERDARRSIHMQSLRVHPRIYYADSPFGRFPDGPFHPAYRRGYGPYYLVNLTEGGVPVLTVAVSALTQELWVDERGLVQISPLSGNEFISHGISADTTRANLLTPEHAAARTAVRTGARVAAPPVLMRRNLWYTPVLSVWKVEVDRPVRVRGVDQPRNDVVRTMYVDGRGKFFLPADEQPTGDTYNFVIGPPWELRDRRTMSATVPVLPGRVTEWREVIPQN